MALAAGGAGVPARSPAPGLAAPGSSATTEQSPVVRLVGHLTTLQQPEGDATLISRSQAYTDGKKVDVWDLHADNGDYFFARTRAGLPARVEKGRSQLDPADEAGRERAVAAAKLAARGDLNEARKRMARAFFTGDNPPPIEAPGAVKPLSEAAKIKAKATGTKAVAGNYTDNWVWNTSVDALRDGAGDPAVRAGVLRLLDQMPEIKVEEGALEGRRVLTLTAGAPAVDSPESVIVDAGSGMPVKYTTTFVTTTYTVTRVTLADVAAGKF
ncbi:hypothetical protein M1L60_21835 [Actinoplanes sp. TRM 88003]|uniref:Lipoprotein n=1 Tax=Paractinoplanes aksuensis TaxID=2939490 RepID=A0ABT1DQW4_9ACTN|nr:hypothetical protein [Actinoplanes aksuensis]MCO8273237.1 hypothetical protein [Actinoplanes aksuensis]